MRYLPATRALLFQLIHQLILLSTCVEVAEAAVVTQHNDHSRTGANLGETILTTSNVNVSQFGKLFTRPVDGQIYAQPLHLSNVNIPGKGTRNVVFVATMHNSVYAFDADDPAASTPFWQRNLGPSVPYQDATSALDITPQIGITGTPAIDVSTNTLFLVAKTKESNTYFQRLHALDLSTGQQKPSSPVVITASVSGTGDGSVNGTIVFNALKQLNRPGLLLLNGNVYLAFGSHGDSYPAHGWVIGYSATTLQRTDVFITSPNGSLGAIWQSGQGLAADSSGYIYLMTGNGSFNYNTGGPNLGMSFVKLSTPDLSVVDWFTPYNYSTLNSVDADLGASGPLLIPGTNLLVGGGKEGVFHVLNRSNMGHFQAGSNGQIVQNFQAALGHIHGSPIYWNGPNGPFVYVWSEGDQLKQFKLVNSLFQTSPVAKSSMFVPGGMPGAFLSLSANGNSAGSGIVWASHPFSGDANHATVPGILRAFDAANVSIELWNSKQDASRDDLGNFAKNVPPTVANGKVYLATFSNQLVVYGLDALPSTLPVPWLDQDIGSVGVAGSASYTSGTFTVRGSGTDIEDVADEFHYVYRSLNGDGQIVARVASQQNTNEWAKAGVMIRETLTAGSKHAMTVITPGNGIAFQRRQATGGTTLHTAGSLVTAPYWVKLVRSGNILSGYQSSNGVNWTLVGSDTITMTSGVYVGLAVTAHNNGVLNTSILDSVTVTVGTGNTAPSVSLTAPANGASYAAPANIAITAAATDTGGSVTKVDFYAGTTLLGTDTTNPYSYAWNNVGVGSYSLTAVATDNLGATRTSAVVNISVNSATGSLPSPWLNQDIGSVGVAGSASYTSGTFTVRGSGADIWDTADGFHYVYRSLNGDGQITARVASLQNTDPWAKVGVMIRETLTATSRHATMTVTSANGLAFFRRLSSGGTTTRPPLVTGAAPVWVRLVRSGNTLSGYYSTNGVNWNLVGSDTIAMGSGVYIGLAATAHNNTVLNTATFDSVTVASGTAPLPVPWLDQDIGSVGVAGSASYTSGTFTVRGSGTDIEDVADEFHYVYRSLNGDGQIVARVASQQNTNEWAKAGVMIRETLTAGSKHAMTVITPGNGIAFQRRQATGGTTLHTAGSLVTAPYWVKLVRSGNILSGYQSSNGVNWTLVGSDTITMTSGVYVGLAVTAHDNGALNTSTLDNVVKTP